MQAIARVTIESLIPDFKGDWDTLQIVLDTPPEVLSHNLETVPNKYRRVRPQARYKRSLELLLRTKRSWDKIKNGHNGRLGRKKERSNRINARLCGS